MAAPAVTPRHRVAVPLLRSVAGRTRGLCGADDEGSDVCTGAAGTTGPDDPADADDEGSDVCPCAELSRGAIAASGGATGRLISSSAAMASSVF